MMRENLKKPAKFRKFEVTSDSTAKTEEIGQKIGSRLKGGEVLELVSDLGGGKTTFVRGLAKGMGSADQVSSPTFKLCNIYKSKTLELHHYDFYRLNEGGIVSDEFAESIVSPGVVVVVEWGGVVQGVLPKQRMAITITPKSAASREFSFVFPGNLNYAMDKLC